jgi:hypothetical protein
MALVDDEVVGVASSPPVVSCVGTLVLEDPTDCEAVFVLEVPADILVLAEVAGVWVRALPGRGTDTSSSSTIVSGANSKDSSSSNFASSPFSFNLATRVSCAFFADS